MKKAEKYLEELQRIEERKAEIRSELIAQLRVLTAKKELVFKHVVDMKKFRWSVPPATGIRQQDVIIDTCNTPNKTKWKHAMQVVLVYPSTIGEYMEEPDDHICIEQYGSLTLLATVLKAAQE